MTDFWKADKNTSSSEAVIFGAVVAAVLVVFLIVRVAKKKPSLSKDGRPVSSGSGRFSVFTLFRLAKSAGLNHVQTKMLSFVLKNDSVTDIEKSLQTLDLLDRHFKRAYRTIESSASNDTELQERMAVLFSTRNMLENNTGGSLNSSLQFRENNRVILNFGKEKFQTTVTSSVKDYLAVKCPQNALGTPLAIPRNITLDIVVFTANNKGFSFESRVTGNSASRGAPVLHLAHSNRLKALSQRRFRRKQTDIACNFFFVYVKEGRKKRQRLVLDKKRLTGNIMDISGGGCSIKTTAQVKGGSRIKVEFTRRGNMVAALGQVLRTNRTGVNSIIHIKFLKVSRKSMNVINAHVFGYADE
ncbi:MAG: PilZ domain-containing protein [Treponema sp.]|nr:PilZ domain-containing protein [Treponema sp.]